MDEKLIKLICDSRIDLVPLLGKAVKGICTSLNINEELLYQLELCIVEAINNVICHGYKNTLGHEIEVLVILKDDKITFQMTDNGFKNLNTKRSLEFDPKVIDSLPESGMGLFIIQQIMDEVSHQEVAGKNVITMSKKILDKHKPSIGPGKS